MIHWLRDRRRRRITQQPFPEEWAAILSRNVPHSTQLNADEQSRLRDFIQVFVAEKNWEGCGGLELNDEIRVTISAQAGLLVLGRPHQYFRNVQSILVYPTTIVTPERTLSHFTIPGVVPAAGIPILGEAHLGGPILLVWDRVKQNARHPEQGHDVVYHEFAHKLDMLDGAADGTPILGSRAETERWAHVCGEAFEKLRDKVQRGQGSFLDAYGATNEAEFFAVATEFFFDQSRQMKKQEPDLYAVLQDFYGQDPAARPSQRPS
ncbi:MAG: zinc-dependent peptidase [Myxococcota bacterium]|nr:zinc-dependent peptidase [Myxococcota bacterium]